MNIIYFHQYFCTPKGSGGTRSYFIAKALVKSGHEVKVVCLNDKRSNTGLKSSFKNGFRKGKVEGIEVIEINLSYSNKLNLYQRSIAFLKFSLICSLIAIKSECDLIYATSTPLTIAIPAIFGKIIRGRKFIFEVRDLWPELPKALGIVKNPVFLFLLDSLERLAYYYADICIGLAPGICEGIAKKGFKKENIYLFPNASDIKLFSPIEINKKKNPKLIPSLRKYIKTNSFVAAFTGAHGKANGLDLLIEVALELKRRNRKDIFLILIGEGICKENLQKKVLRNNLTNCFFIPSIPKEKLAVILRESVDVGLMVLKNIPEFYEGTSPNKFFDYISSGLPIINNYPGWISRLIKEYNIGIAVKPDDYIDFTNALITLADDRENLNLKGINARNLAIEKFSCDKLSSNVVEVIEKTCLKNLF